MDKELLSLFSERESSKIRAELQSEIHAVRLELEKQRSENSELLQKTDGKIENAKSEITEAAINKTLGILAHVRMWIILVGIIFGVGTFLGWKGFESYMKTYFKEGVEAWLRFEDGESGSKKALDEIRTQAILDAYTIRLARSYTRPFGVHSVSLTQLEIDRLVEILLDPSTNYADFADSLRLVTKSRGTFRLSYPEDEIGKKLLNILGDDDYGSHKKGLILENMKNDQALFPYAKGILNDSKNSDNVRVSAFQNVANFDADYALKFAEENVNSFSGLHPRTEFVEYLAKFKPNSNLVRGFLNTLSSTKQESWELSYLSIILSLVESEAQETADYLPDFISKLISNGLKLRLTDSSFGPRYIALSLNGASVAVNDPKKFLSDEGFINTLVLSKSVDIDWLETITGFFQVFDNGYYVTTLLTYPSSSSKYILENSSEIDGNDINGPAWLRLNESPAGRILTITWRDKAGKMHENQLTDVVNAEENSYQISFDANVVENLSIRNFNYQMRLW